LLPKLNYCHGDLIKKLGKKKPTKKPSQNGRVQINLFNGTLVKLDMGAKKPYGGFLIEIPGQKS
jgi:hypothetical protein